MKALKLLVVVDESRAAAKALTYVARVAAHRRDLRVCLVHTLPSLPPELLEYGGGHDPEEQNLMSARQKTDQKDWVAAAKKKTQPILNRARAVLQKNGLPAGAIETGICYPADGRAAISEILILARARRYRTVVLGRQSLSWLAELIHGDPAEQLVRQGKGFTIWVVE